jgi:hypothetical protein
MARAIPERDFSQLRKLALPERHFLRFLYN